MEKASQAVLDLSKSTQKTNTTIKSLGTGLSNTTQKIDKVGKSTQKTSQQFNAFGISGQKIGGSLNSVNNISNISSQKIDKLGLESQQTSQQFTQLSGASQQMGRHIQAISLSANRAIPNMDRLGSESQQTSQQMIGLNSTTQKTRGAIQSMGPPIDNTTRKIKNLSAETKRNQTSSRQMDSQTEKTNKAFNAQGESVEQLTDAIRQNLRIQKQFKDALGSMGAASKKTKGALGGLNTEFKNTSKSVYGFDSATRSGSDGTLALGNSIASLAGTFSGISDTVFGFQEKMIALEKSKFGLTETTEDLKRAEEDYETILEEGIITGRELERVEKDLTLLRTKLKIETEEVRAEEEALNSEYVAFAVNLATAGLQMTTMIPTLKEMGIFTKIAALENTKLGIASKKVTLSMLGQAGATRTATTATHGLTAAAKGFLFSPVGIALMALGGLWLAWETNALGFRDAVHEVINAFQTLGGWIVDMFVPGLNAVSTILRAIGIDVPKLGDKLKGLSGDISDNIDQWQELEKAERAAGEEAEKYEETATEMFATISRVAESTQKEMVMYAELSYSEQAEALEKSLKYAQQMYTEHMTNLKKEQSLLSEKTDIESQRRLKIINQEIKGTKEEYQIATTAIQTEIDKVTGYTESAMQELGLMAKESTDTTIQLYDNMTTEIKEDYDNLNEYATMSFNSQLDALQKSLKKTNEFYTQHIAELKREQEELTTKTDSESKLRLQILNDELEATLKSYHATVDGIQTEIDKVTGYTESAMYDMGLITEMATDKIEDEFVDAGDKIIDTTLDIDDSFENMTDNMGDNFEGLTDSMIAELARVQKKAEDVYANLHKKDWDKVFSYEDSAAEFGIHNIKTTGKNAGEITTDIEGWYEAQTRLWELEKEMRYATNNENRSRSLLRDAHVSPGQQEYQTFSANINSTLENYVSRTEEWISKLQDADNTKFISKISQPYEHTDHLGKTTTKYSGNNVWGIHEGKFDEGAFGLDDIRDIIDLDALRDALENPEMQKYVEEIRWLLKENTEADNHIQWSDFDELTKQFLDQEKVALKIEKLKNEISEDGLNNIRVLFAEMEKELSDGVVGDYAKGFGADNIYRSDHGNYKFELDIDNLGANAGRLLQGLTIGKNEDGSIGDLTGISYTAEEGWFNKITNESFTDFMQAQRAALENSTAYQMAQVNNIIQPLIDKANIEREAAGQEQIT